MTRGKKIWLFVLWLAVWPGAVDFAAGADAGEELNLLVQQFILSEDAAQSEGLLKEILKDKSLTVQKAETLLKWGRLYPPEPHTGSLHKDIRVAGYDMSYALYVPKDYDPKKAYPLVVCLHGAGFVGDAYIDRWQPRLGDDVILVCPTIGAGAWWSPQGERLVMKTIESVTSQYRVDTRKIFLTGMSNGGIGVYLIGMFYANRFAAISPMASGIPEEVFPFLKNFSSAGIYIIHGANDQVMPVRLSQEITAYLKKEGIPFIYREHGKEHPRAGGHFFPREELPALVKWLNAQRRIADPAQLTFVADRVHRDPYYWVEINETVGKIADVQKSIFTNEEVELVKKGAFASLSAEIEGNAVNVTTERVGHFTLFFNDRLIDFSKPVRVTANGKKVFEGRLTESAAFMLKEAKRRADDVSFYTASVVIDLAKTP
ncbi:MAG: alpha/beta hydrolase-fold protein [Nitrospiria bacterium]